MMTTASVVVVWVAALSPLAHLDHRLLTAHMVQHLLLMLIAAPLVLLGARPKRFSSKPSASILCWLAGSLTVIVWHVPAVFALAQTSHLWHMIGHVNFFVAGIIFWWPVLRPGALSVGFIPVYLFLATLPCDALSAYLAFCGHVIYSPYSTGGNSFGLSALEDQTLAGALMWVTVTFGYLIPALVAAGRLVSGHEGSRASVC